MRLAFGEPKLAVTIVKLKHTNILEEDRLVLIYGFVLVWYSFRLIDDMVIDFHWDG